MTCSCTCHKSNIKSLCCSCICDYDDFPKTMQVVKLEEFMK